jgi:hypothetical protein
VVLGQFTHHCNEIHPSSRAVVVPTRPVLPMSNLKNKDKLPEVDENLPEKLKRHSKLFSAPEQLKNKEHINGGADCHCAPTRWYGPFVKIVLGKYLNFGTRYPIAVF